MKRLSTLEVIQALLSEGHTVEYYVRPAEKRHDEPYSKQGYRITKVDNEVFKTSDAQGNNYARAMLVPKFQKAAKLTPKEVKQRRKANPMTSLPKLTARQINAMRKANRELAKTSVGKGHYNQKTIRKRKKMEGWGATAQSMRNAVSHYKGFAYRANALAFADVLKSADVMPNTEAFLRKHPATLRDTDIKDAYHYYYSGLKHTITWFTADELALNLLKTGYEALKAK